MPQRLSWPRAALIGVIALVAALAFGHFVAGFININASPYLAVGNGAIDLTPPQIKDFAVQTFGTNDKFVLLTGMAVVMVLAAAGAGIASRRSKMPGTIVIVIFGLVGVVAVAARPTLGEVALLAPVASLAVGVGVFLWLHHLANRQTQISTGASADSNSVESDPVETDTIQTNLGAAPSRRKFLITSTGVVVASGVAGVGGQLLSTSREATASRDAIGKLVPARTAPAIPAGADFAAQGTPTFITSNRDFYRVDTALAVPQLRAEDWTLRLHGMVDHEKLYNYADIRNRPLIERIVTLTCVSNDVGGPYISTASFIGVDLVDLLNKAGVQSGAEQLFCTSVDGWTSGTPVAAAIDPNRGAMLAIGMNGEPLPVEHGFPARLVIPGLYGYVSATKWVTDLEVTTWKAKQAYWLERGWAQQAPIKTESRIDKPVGFDVVPAGKVQVAGIAWAQHTGINKVEVRLDNGPWQQAALSREVNTDTWRMWLAELSVSPGVHQVSCRATDDSGYTQTADRVSVIPNGATGLHTITFTAH